MSATVPDPRSELRPFLKNYGFLGFDLEPEDERCSVVRGEGDRKPRGRARLLLVEPGGPTPSGLSLRGVAEGTRLYSAGQHTRGWRRRPAPVYRTLLPALSVSGDGLQPLWTTAEGDAVLAWWERGSRRDLVVGLQVAAEILRYTHGDPFRAERFEPQEIAGFTHERPIYLFEHQVDPEFPTLPWADRLGFALAEALSREAGIPLLHPLPDGARGALLLTGDDDQAELEKYQAQLELLGDFPITYLLLPTTNHTPASLSALPENVELGLHVDALPAPDRYDEICAEQAEAVRSLTGRPIESVRNHGHLNRGYWGQLGAWERCGLGLDLNVHAWDHTARLASFLPFRVRRPDGSWSGHWSLFSGFSDAMKWQLGLSPRKQSRLIRRMAAQVEGDRPGILVLNFHPQNVDQIVHPHRSVLALGRRPGWCALGAESLLQWLRRRDGIVLRLDPGKPPRLASPGPVERMACRVAEGDAWKTRPIGAFEGSREISP